MAMPAPAGGPVPPIEKTRRAGKYTHPFGGMRRFAEDRARTSGWDVDCLALDHSDKRKSERNKLSDKLAEQYKEAFITINVEQGKGRPKANNISAAKKTVKMIAERVLLALEARATQMMFKEFSQVRKKNEVELSTLRKIEACGAENPMLTYDQVKALVAEKLQNEECLSDEFLPGEKLVKPETALAVDSSAQPTLPDMKEFVDDDDAGREALKQALVEMRAEEITKGGGNQTLISHKWVQQLTAAATELVQENYSKHYVPRSSDVANGAVTTDGNCLKDGNGMDAVDADGKPVLGCSHFRRKNRVLLACCGTFPVCRMCHFLDQSRIHDIRIEPVETMLCVMCGNVQPKAQSCTRCHTQFGSYYCGICGITDDPVGVDLRHCDKCRVCMPGMTFHCDLCRACFALPVADHFAAVHHHSTTPVTPPAPAPAISHHAVSHASHAAQATHATSNHQLHLHHPHGEQQQQPQPQPSHQQPAHVPHQHHHNHHNHHAATAVAAAAAAAALQGGNPAHVQNSQLNSSALSSATANAAAAAAAAAAATARAAVNGGVVDFSDL